MPSRKVIIIAAALMAVIIIAAVTISSYQNVAFQYEKSTVTEVQLNDFTVQDNIRLTAALLLFPADEGRSLMSAATYLVDSISLNASVRIINNGLLPASIDGLKYNLFTNGTLIGNGSYSGSVTVAPGTNASIIIVQDIDFDAMSNATVSAIANNGTLGITVTGQAQSGLFNIPFDYETQVNIKQAVKDAVVDYLSGD